MEEDRLNAMDFSNKTWIKLFILFVFICLLVSCTNGQPWYKGWKPQVKCVVGDPRNLKALKDECITQPQLGIVKEF